MNVWIIISKWNEGDRGSIYFFILKSNVWFNSISGGFILKQIYNILKRKTYFIMFSKDMTYITNKIFMHCWFRLICVCILTIVNCWLKDYKNVINKVMFTILFRRYMAEILPIRHKTPINQSIKNLFLQLFSCPLKPFVKMAAVSRTRDAPTLISF